MAEIENLSITVSASADEAYVALDRLISKLNRTKIELKAFAAGAVVSALKEIKSNASAAASALNRFANAQERANRAMGGFTGAGYTSTMRGAASDANTATNAITRFVNAMATAQSAMQRMRYANPYGSNRPYAPTQPRLTGEVQEPIETTFVDDDSGDLNGFEHEEPGVQRFDWSLRSLRDTLRSILQPLGDVGKQLGSVFAAGARRAAHSLAGFFSGLLRIAKFRIFRTIVKDLGQSFKDLYGWSNAFGTDFAGSMDKITTAFTYLRNSIAAMTAPLVNALAPALDYIVDRVVDVLNWFNQLFAVIGGQDTYTVAKKVAVSFGDTLTSTSRKAKKAADEIKRTILGFDEINKLVAPKNNSTSGGSGSSPYSSNYKNMFEQRSVTSNGFGSALSKWVESEIGRINAIVDVSAMALGLILALHGSPVGFGLLAAGALDMGASILAYDDRITPEVKAAISGILGIAGIGLAIGAVLAFSSANVGLGLGLMIASIGALGGSYKIASVNWDAISELLRGPIGTATGLISGASLVLGILALICNNVPLGLGLILAGATGLAATVAANWNNLRNLGVLAIKMVKAGWDSLKDKAFQIAVNVINDAVKWWANVRHWWDGVVGTVAGFATSVINNAATWWMNVRHWWDGVVGTVAGFVTGVINNAATWWMNVRHWWDGVVGKVAGFATSVINDAVKWWMNVKRWWAGVVGKVAGFTTSVINNAATWWSNVKKWWGEKVGSVAGFTVNMINDAVKWWNDVKAFWEEATKDLSLGAAVDFLINVSVKIAGRIWDGVTSFWDWLWGKGGNVQPTGMIGSKNKMAEITATVDAVAGKNMIGGASKFSGGLAPDVSDVDVVARVDADPEWGWAWNLLSYLGINNLDTSVWVDAETPWGYWHKSPLEWLGLSNLSTVVSVTAKVVGSVAGVVGKIFGKATGGVYSGGRWSDIPQYAGGKAGVNHGSLFWAGENGAEIVGNAGGRTEVLNKSQIASAMYSAVQAAMAPAAANFAEAAANMGVAETGFDFETLADMVRQGVEQAMSRSNDYDRQKVELLRSINEKDFNVDVSTASINKAQSRMNRRAGVTIAPVGT